MKIEEYCSHKNGCAARGDQVPNACDCGLDDELDRLRVMEDMDFH